MPRRVVIAAALTVGLTLAAAAVAQPRTDVVTLTNGDRVTGEVVRLERGQLEFKTDDAGTILFEWDNVAGVLASREFEVEAATGDRFLGRLGGTVARRLEVISTGGTTTLPMSDVTLITPIGTSLWRRLDGAVDVGFSYTRSSGIAQLNVNSDTTFRRPSFEGRLAISLTATRQQQDGDRDDRGSLDLSYVRYPWSRWFVSAGGRFESNESLGLRLRSQLVGTIGPRFVNSNRARVLAGAGIGLSGERRVDAPSAGNLEGILVVRASYFTYDRPKTNLDLGLQVYPSLSDAGRWRLQLDASARRELWKDFFVGINLFDTFDNRPPTDAFAQNDVGVVLSVGWSY